MADFKINSRDEIVSISTDGGSTYKPFACLTTNEMTFDGAPIDTTSKCGNEFKPPVKKSGKITFEGFTLNQYGSATKVSTSGFYSLYDAGTEFLFKKAKAVPTTGDNVFAGTAFINNLVVTDADGEFQTFKGEMTFSQPDEVTETPAY